MKKVLLVTIISVFGLMFYPAIAQQTITLKIIETHKDGETSISFDDGEFENDSIDKINDDDLDMGWEGEDLNIMTTYTRFQKVTIPQGATINSAKLFIYAHEDESAEAKVTIFGEAVDDSPMFSETEALDNRMWTSTSVKWDITENWTMWQQYQSPDFSSLIQEIVDRPGWASGNALTLFFRGEDQGASLLDNARDFESFENIEDPDDGGDGLHHPERIPTLVIEYTAPSLKSVLLKIIETHKDGETSISFDDGEFENDSIDKLNDDDLDMGWEGEDLNIMTSYTRFQNVPIPKGSLINSAKLKIYAHEDESDEARVTIYGEKTDNSSMFNETEAITDRTWTTTSVKWDIMEEWTMWHPYESPDVSAIIQEIVNLDNWKTGNALTLFMQGEDQGASLLDNARDFESFENIEDPDDGGDGLHHPERVPMLEIEYTPPVMEGELILTIIETHKDGETSISFDDGEFENDSIDKLNDDDLDMGWEGEDLNIMTTYTRFQNVTIPQGAKIDSAVLVIYAHEDESAEAKVTIFAEDIDNSQMFAENEAISDRAWTKSSVKWNITEDWTMWQQYHSPNIASLVQTVIDKPEWKSGNALTLFLRGEDQGASLLDNARDFESFENIEDPDDGGDGLHHPERIPTLKIYYTLKTTAVSEISIGIDQPEMLNLFPNPVENGRLNLSHKSKEIRKAGFYNINGQLVKQFEINSQTALLDINDLKNGIYLIRVTFEDEVISKKLIINK